MIGRGAGARRGLAHILTCRRAAGGGDEVEAMQLLSGGFAEAAVLQRQGDCRALEANAERGEARRGGGNSDWRDERRAGGRRDGVDGTGETRTVEVFVRGDPRWDPRGEYKRFRAAFGDG